MTVPVTLASLIRGHKLLWVYCRDCRRERELDPETIPLPGGFPRRMSAHTGLHQASFDLVR